MPGITLPIEAFGTPANGTIGIDADGSLVFQKAGVKQTVSTGGAVSYDMLSQLVNSPLAVTATTRLDASAFGRWVEADMAFSGASIALPPRAANVGKMIGIRYLRTLAGATPGQVMHLRPDTQVFMGGPTSINTPAARLSDGRFVLASTSVGGVSTPSGFVLINADGTVDSAFQTAMGTGPNNIVQTINVDASDNIYVSGTFTSWNGTARPGFLRMSAAGVVDTTFHTNIGTAATGISVVSVRASDGLILVGGSFTTFNGVTRNRLVALNSNGTVNTTYQTNLGTALGAAPTAIVFDSSGQAYVGGSFTTFNGTTRNRLIRLSSAGVEDATYYTNIGTGGIGSTGVSALAVQPSNDRLLVGGTFGTVGTTTARCLARLLTTGAPDTTFITNMNSGTTNATDSVLAIAVASDGSIVVAGNFSRRSFASTAASIPSSAVNIAKLSSTGAKNWPYSASPGGVSALTSVRLWFETDDVLAISYNHTGVQQIGLMNTNMSAIARIPAGGLSDFIGMAMFAGESVVFRAGPTRWEIVSANLMNDWMDVGTINIGATITAPTFGTTTMNTVRLRRVGLHMLQVQYMLAQTTAGTVGGNEYHLAVPYAFNPLLITLDTGTIPNPPPYYGSAASNVSGAIDSGAANPSTITAVIPYSNQNVRVVCAQLGGTASAYWGSGLYPLNTAAVTLSLSFSYQPLDI